MLVGVFLRGLVAVAPGHQHVPCLRHDQIAGLEHRGIAPAKIAFKRTVIGVWRCRADPGAVAAVDIAGAAARMAAIEHPGDVRLVFGDVVDQQRQFLVGKIEIAVADAAVDADQHLIALVEIVLLELRRGRRA